MSACASGKGESIRQNKSRHYESTKLSPDVVRKSNNNMWLITSSDGSCEYTVCLENRECPTKCELKCKECGICVHTYSCTCRDALINHTICKHIHLVARNTATKRCEENSERDVQYESKKRFQFGSVSFNEPFVLV